MAASFPEGIRVQTSASLPDSCIVNANISADAGIARSKLAQDALAVFPVPLTSFRVWDSVATNLPATSATADLGLYGGTWGTNTMSIKTSDLKAAGATTRYARVSIQLPECYEAGQTVQIRVRGYMETTVADVSATVDLEVYESNRAGGVSADLCATAATTLNSLVPGYQTFTITATDLSPGDWIEARVAVAVNDAATATAVIAAIGGFDLLADVKG